MAACKGPWSWGLSYRARLPLTVNPQGYMWGNYQEVNAWGGYTWFPASRRRFAPTSTFRAHIVGADWWLIGKLPSADPEYYGGKRIEMNAGADIDGKLFGFPGFSIGVEAGVPVYQNLDGPQISKNWQAGMALRWKIGEPGAETARGRIADIQGSAGRRRRSDLALGRLPCRRERRLYLGGRHQHQLYLPGPGRVRFALDARAGCRPASA